MTFKLRTLSFFNNKGGVGKTTLSTNVAHYFATQGKRVLYVDCDPQCNATQLMLTDKQCEEIYGRPEDTDEVLQRSLTKSVFSIFIPLIEGEPTIDSDIHVVHSERFKVDVLPGHPNLSQIEDVMSEAWSNALSRKTGDFRRIHWAGQLATAMEDANRYDVIFFDVGPSLGPFNRTVLLGCDAFVTPTATDLFSYHAFGNLARWFEHWTTEYSEIAEGNKDSWSRITSDLSTKTRALRLPGENGRKLDYLGYTTLEYVKRKSNGTAQLVGAFERFRDRFADEATRIGYALSVSQPDYLLGYVPHMHSMPAAAQDGSSPIADLGAKDGVRGSQLNQRTSYVAQINQVAENVMKRFLETPQPLPADNDLDTAISNPFLTPARHREVLEKSEAQRLS